MHPGDNVRNTAISGIVVVAVVIAVVVAATALATGGTIGGAVSAEPDPDTPPSTAATATAPTTPDSSPTATPTPGGVTGAGALGQGIGRVKARLGDGQPLSITVLGDDSSAGDNGWVFLWARDTLGADHTVVYHEYSRGTGYAAPRTLAANGPTVDVWNASYLSATAPKDTTDLASLYPQPTDIVILNLGHQDDPATFDADVTALWQAVTAQQTPLGLVMLQNPETATTSLQDTRMRNLARTADRLGLPAVDVHTAFAQSTVPLPELVIGARPTPQGAELWVATVAAALK
ncbi:hypothetical protein [Raineyella sp. LH-20]|uniref:hypothetical protein n=1 Tax=Raineyella sp. LH-20 TaxID=3081204 RepID=UPI0029543C17|nr:hypothetical protein [Raineyella sp. LH-20]WOP17636.1 hypothetical protein R0146_10200 [Raineyella sp. LH-20]